MKDDILNTDVKPLGMALSIFHRLLSIFPLAFFFVLICSIMFYFSNIGFVINADTVISAIRLLLARLIGSLPFVFAVSIGLSLLVSTGASGRHPYCGSSSHNSPDNSTESSVSD